MSLTLCCRRFITPIKARLLQPNRHGYIVLLPEIKLDLPESTALLKDDIPDFSSLTAEKCSNSIGKNLLELEHGVRIIEQAVESAGCTDVVRDIIEPLELLNTPLESSWGIIKTLYLTRTDIMPAKTYLPLNQRARRARSYKFQSKAIYSACKEADRSKMTEEEQRMVHMYVLEGKLSGIELGDDHLEQFLNNRKKMADHLFKYDARVKISAGKFYHVFHDPNVTRDMPDKLLRLMAENKEEPSRGPWKITLEPLLKELFMAYCPNRDLRWNVWSASTRVASHFYTNQELRNSTTLEKFRDLKMTEAKLLGYETYAHLSMETKMAGSLENVQQTLYSMQKIAKPAADKEVAELQQYAWERGFEGPLQVWDIPFWQRKQKRTLFNYKEETLNDFLPFDKVWTGLVELSEKLFNIRFEENDKVSKWHPDVKFFYVFEDSNKPIAGIYLDPYARDGKLRTGRREAWVVNISPAARKLVRLPLSSLILQLDAPIYGKPALMDWADVELLFKYFGRTLQQLLTTVNYAEVAGQSNVEWDAVDIVGNVFLHWLKDRSVLDSISGHYATGEKLPPLPFDDIEKHFAGYRLCEELFMAFLDLEMYSKEDFWVDIVKRLWPAHFILPRDKWDATPLNSPAIVSEQWASAYYSHVWSRMVAADVYSAFTEPNVDVKSVGARFRDTYLAFGGSCAPGEVFRRFCGRDPSTEAFFKYLGLH